MIPISKQLKYYAYYNNSDVSVKRKRQIQNLGMRHCHLQRMQAKKTEKDANEEYIETRMYSSRMRTARFSGRL